MDKPLLVCELVEVFHRLMFRIAVPINSQQFPEWFKAVYSKEARRRIRQQRIVREGQL
jgi:hypothetical protein